MNIAVIGLGLIGGSICRALNEFTFHTVFGTDKNPETIRKAIEEKAIVAEIKPSDLKKIDLTFVCLYPNDTIQYIKENADNFKKGSIVADVSGVKECLVDTCTIILKEKDVYFVGTHPMAGREFSGFEYSTATLYQDRSFIITPSEDTPQMAVDLVSALANSIGFSKIVITTPKRHDEVIAYTSQLAHVVSNAYVKSPEMENFNGFTAGSFQDLTRVAKLNEYMWSELFLCNREPLLKEIEYLIRHLQEYQMAIKNNDRELLVALLRDGRERKEHSNLILEKEKANGK